MFGNGTARRYKDAHVATLGADEGVVLMMAVCHRCPGPWKGKRRASTDSGLPAEPAARRQVLERLAANDLLRHMERVHGETR